MSHIGPEWFMLAGPDLKTTALLESLRSLIEAGKAIVRASSAADRRQPLEKRSGDTCAKAHASSDPAGAAAKRWLAIQSGWNE